MRNKNPIILIALIVLMLCMTTSSALAKNKMDENNKIAGALNEILSKCPGCFIGAADSGNLYSFIDNDQNDLLPNTTANESPPNMATFIDENTMKNLNDLLANGNNYIMKGNTIAPACLSTNTGVGMPVAKSCNTCHSGNNVI